MMRGLTQALLLATAAAADVSCVDPYDSTQLSEAFDAAMMELQGAKGWFTQLKTSTGYHNAQSVNSCTPGPQWKYPAASDATGLLKRVLESGELRVAGVQWAKGEQADYITDPDNPTGFWPEYLTEIVQKLSENYGKTITVKRIYYTTDPNGLGASQKVGHAVADGVDDMSEPYYYLGGAHDEMPRIESLAFSCITAGLESFFFTKADSGTASTDALFNALSTGNNKAVGFIGSGNYDSVSHLLPADVTVTLVTNASVMEANVKSGVLVAGYNSEGTTSDNETFTLFATGIVSPRVALFRKPDPTICTVLMPPSPPPASKPDPTNCTVLMPPSPPPATDEFDSLHVGLVITLGVLAVVLLLTVSIVVHLIRMEKKGSPLFMPLMKERDVEAVAYPAKGADANTI